MAGDTSLIQNGSIIGNYDQNTVEMLQGGSVKFQQREDARKAMSPSPGKIKKQKKKKVESKYMLYIQKAQTDKKGQNLDVDLDLMPNQKT